jgi:hypothetical protein
MTSALIRKTLVILALACAVGLTGCTTDYGPPHGPPPPTAPVPPPPPGA